MSSIPILMYHEVGYLSDEIDPYGLSITPEAFDTHMNYLHQQGYTCLSLLDFVKAKLAGKPIPKKSVAITFDDGYRDNYENAWPILKKYDFTATIFLVANLVGGETSWEGQNGERALPILSWDQIYEMQEGGIYFGSHTCTHPRLHRIPLPEAHREMSEAKKILEKKLQRPVELFAYPYENFNHDIFRLAEECGYLAAFGAHYLPENRYNYWRIECGKKDTLDKFAFKVSRWYRPNLVAKTKIRGLQNRFKSLIGKKITKTK